jgi:hypothetical protein
MAKPRLSKRILDRVFRSGGSTLLRPLGFAIVPAEVARPAAWGTKPILGSFPPIQKSCPLGDRSTFYIHSGYKHRDPAIYFDDTPNSDQSQLEVYQFAKEICDRDRLKTVVDIGCGSAYKLVRYLGGLKTVGIDVEKTCEWLKAKYPDRTWEDVASYKASGHGVDMVVASDVIEHVTDPDALMATIKAIAPGYIVLSTPDRDLLRLGTHDGPPLNQSHIREWNFAEFEAYVKEHFEVLEHFISCAPQATQCVLCCPRGPATGRPAQI